MLSGRQCHIVQIFKHKSGTGKTVKTAEREEIKVHLRQWWRVRNAKRVTRYTSIQNIALCCPVIRRRQGRKAFFTKQNGCYLLFQALDKVRKWRAKREENIRTQPESDVIMKVPQRCQYKVKIKRTLAATIVWKKHITQVCPGADRSS